jgi:glycosyltransferase involved in cell wall biosynthesis
VTGGYLYDRRIIAELEQLGWQVDLVRLGEGFPRPTASAKTEATTRLLAVPGNWPVLVDGLAFGVLPEAAAALRRTRPLVALVHHPLGLETGLTDDQSALLLATERAALVSAHRVIATSRWTADLLVDRFGVSRGLLTVVQPGTDRFPFSTGSTDGTLRLLSVGAIGPRKGFDVLVDALAPLKHLRWHLTIAGDRERDASAVARLDNLVLRHGLGERVSSIGKVSVDCLAGLHASADLFVLASHFEGYGMAFAEALAHGLPIIGTTGGATPSTVPASAGLLVAPGDVDALSGALRELIENRDLRHRLAAGARTAASTLPTWGDSGAAFSDLLKRLA